MKLGNDAQVLVHFLCRREQRIVFSVDDVTAMDNRINVDAIVHRGYIVDAEDDSLFSSTEEVDEYLSVIAEFHKSEA